MAAIKDETVGSIFEDKSSSGIVPVFEGKIYAQFLGRGSIWG